MKRAATILAGVLSIQLCLAAPGAFAQDTLAEPAPASATTAVRLASYNAWLLPFGISDETEARRDGMGPAIAALEPDVVCFQEIWTDELFEPLAAALSDRLPHAASADGGLATLSRWPIRDVSFRAFPSWTAADIPEMIGRKGWLSMVVETPAGPLRVVNSHLTFDRSDDRADHMLQLLLLMAALNDQSDVPTVLCGDLNMRAFDEGLPTYAFTLLGRFGFHDAANAGGTYVDTARPGTRGGWPRRGRTARSDPDYVLFRQGESGTLSVTSYQQALDALDTALSDHNLQLADFTLQSMISALSTADSN